MMTPNFKLILCDPNRALCDEFEKAFKFPDVEIVCDVFQNIQYDCVVSAANSFGLMDGGIDGAITDHYGLGLQDEVQRRIIDDYAGEQPIGTCLLVPAHRNGILQYVAHTPTMRIPMDISETENVYQAMRAMLMRVHKHNEIHHDIGRVACCGLGALTGGMPLERVAQQMALAYAYFILPRPSALDWTYAVEISSQIESTKR